MLPFRSKPDMERHPLILQNKRPPLRRLPTEKSVVGAVCEIRGFSPMLFPQDIVEVRTLDNRVHVHVSRASSSVPGESPPRCPSSPSDGSSYEQPSQRLVLKADEPQAARHHVSPFATHLASEWNG